MTTQPTDPTTTAPEGPSWWGDDDWWKEILDERDARHDAEIWQPRARGAGALTGYGSGFTYRPSGQQGIWQLTETLTFARSLATIVGANRVTEVRWHRRDGEMSCANVASGLITLEPAAANKAIAGTYTLDQAKTITGGIAIHEASHCANTPADQRIGFLERIARDPARNAYGETILETALSLVEDAYVEAAVLARYPGFLPYLEEQWRDAMPEETIVGHLEALVNPATPSPDGRLVQVMQDRSRRYEAPSARYRELLAQLPPDRRDHLEAGRRILRRAHDARLAQGDRWALAEQLADLLHQAAPAPEDRADLGEQTLAKTNLGDLAQELIDLRLAGLVDAPGRGDDVAGLTGEIAEQVRSALDRDLDQQDVEIVTNTGNATVPVAFIDLQPDAHAATLAREKVTRHLPALAARLKFRAVRPERQIGAQRRGRLQDARLVEFPIAAAVGRQPFAFTRREIISAPRVGLTLLIDMSGSMNKTQSTIEFGAISRATMARYATALLDLALGDLRRATQGGVDYAAFGHTDSWRENAVDAHCLVYRIVDPTRPDDRRIGGIKGLGGNYDGPALAAVGAWGERRWPDRDRLILFINDGLPNGEEYGGSPAHLAIRDHCAYLRSRGTDVLTLYLGQPDGSVAADLATMYGPEGYGHVVVPDLGDLPRVLGDALARILKWQA